MEQTLSGIYESIADRLALARTKHLMGERQEGLRLLESASADYDRYSDALSSLPGFYALKHAHSVTVAAFNQSAESVNAWPGVPTRGRKKRPRP